jgi:hypothetical protein
MRIVTDTHVHLYPCYDLGLAIRNLVENLNRVAAGGAVCAAFLAERADCCFFRDLRTGKIGAVSPGLAILPTMEENGLVLVENGQPRLYLFAGRQVATAERIEILALTVDAAVPDGLSAEETVRRILAAGGVPVLSWAPGKWFFKRRKVVKALINGFGPGQILIGDTSLRPAVWPEPGLMRLARSKGLGVVAGSDPLPFAGEEGRMGSYVSVLDGPFSPDGPVISVRAVLKSAGPGAARVGRRGSLWDVLARLRKNARARKA